MLPSSRNEAGKIVVKFCNVTASPSLTNHIITVILIRENEAIYRLRPVVDFIYQWFAQIIFNLRVERGKQFPETKKIFQKQFYSEDLFLISFLTRVRLLLKQENGLKDISQN